VEFEKYPGHEFDVVNDEFVAQAKPANYKLGQDLRN